MPTQLHSLVRQFLNVLLRTAVRLRILQVMGHIKSLSTVETVNSILLEESHALDTTRDALQVGAYASLS